MAQARYVLVGMLLLMSGAVVVEVQAEPFEFIRINDADSFGFTDLGSLTGPSGGPVDRNQNGKLDFGDTLPDFNGDGFVNPDGDNFDNRTAAESSGTAVSAVGASDFNATSGSDWTDVAVSDSWNVDPATSSGQQPGFVFDFFVEGTDISDDHDVFINVLIADIRPGTHQVRYTRTDGTSLTRDLVGLTDPGTADDGFIQAAFVTVPFADVFTSEETGWRGHLEVEFLIDDPYTAYDYAELSLEAIPEPATLTFLTLGGLALSRRRHAKPRWVRRPR